MNHESNHQNVHINKNIMILFDGSINVDGSFYNNKKIKYV